MVLLLAGLALAQPLVVAVNFFDAHSVRPELEPLGRGASDMLTTDLAAAPELRLVERERLTAVLGELALGRSGFVDPSTAQKLGQGLGADVVIVGSVTIAVEGMRLDARAIDVATGEVRAVAQASGAENEFFKLEHTVAERLLVALGATNKVDERPIPLSAILDGARAIDAADTATLHRLGGLSEFKRRRLVRVPYEYSITSGSGGNVSTTAGSTWVIRDGAGTTLDVPGFAARVGDREMAERVAREGKTAKTVGTVLLVAGGAALLATLVPVAQMEPEDYNAKNWRAISERNGERLVAAAVLSGSGLVVGYAGILIPARQSQRQHWFENYYTPEAADRLLHQGNEALASELGVTPGDVLSLEVNGR